MKRLALLAICLACNANGQSVNPIETEADRKPHTVTGGSCLITHGTVMPITGPAIEGADVLILHGKIAKIGKALTAPTGVTVIDATGKIVLPGFVDAHSHRGEDEVNEWADSAVPEVQIRDVLDPELEGLWFDTACGITSALLLHGSADAIGGQSIIIKCAYRGLPSQMVFPGAPRVVKFALGENVTQKNDQSSTRFPQTRMGVEEVYRRAFADAKAYAELKKQYREKASAFGSSEQAEIHLGPPPRIDLRLEALCDILAGKILVHCHSYRQDELLMMVKLSQEYGFKLATLTHALEAYKITPELRKAGIPVSMFGDTWDYKLEVFDSIPMGAALCMRAGLLTSVNTDTFSGIAPLNLDAAKMMRYGVSEEEALKSITLYPARQLGISGSVGSLEPAKDGDVTIWSGHPLSIYSRCEETLINGEVVFQRRDAFHVNPVATTKPAVQPSPLIADRLPDLAPAKAYAIVGGTIHPVNGPDIPDGVLVMCGQKIVAVGDKSTPIPSDALKVPAKGFDLYPGFVDGGSDLGLGEIGSVKQASDAVESGPMQPDLHALTAVNPESVKFGIARCAGVTTAAVNPGGGSISGLDAVILPTGFTADQMKLSEGGNLIVNWPESLDPTSMPSMPPDQLTKQKKDVEARRTVIKDYFATAKRAADAGDLSDPKLAALAPCFTGKRKVAFLVNGEGGIRTAVRFAKETGLTAAIYAGLEAWKAADLLAKNHIPVIYAPPPASCPGETQPMTRLDPYDTPYVAPYLLKKAGVKFGLASGDSGSIHDLPNRAGLFCAFGLSPVDALRSITQNTADILGVGDQVGSLEKGKLANVLIVKGDPLEITGQVVREFIAGKPVTLTSKFTQLYRKYEGRLSEMPKAQ